MNRDTRLNKNRPIGMFLVGLGVLLAGGSVGSGQAAAQGVSAQQPVPSNAAPATPTAVWNGQERLVPEVRAVAAPAASTASSVSVPVPQRPAVASAKRGRGAATRVTARPAAPRVPDAITDGRVVQIGPGYAIVDLGSDEGIVEGTVLSLRDKDTRTLTQRQVPHMVVGAVTGVEPHRARVDLGVNEWAKVGYQVWKTGARATASHHAPPAPLSPWSMGLMVRPMLPEREPGGGVLVDAEVSVRPIEHLRFDVVLAPFAFASGKEGPATAWQLYGLANFDHRLFSFGLGVGMQSLAWPTSDVVSSGANDKVVGALVQELRIGARDGIHVRATGLLAYAKYQFRWSGVRIRTQFPLTRNLWLVPSGGGGMAGFATGELGVRALVSGNGERDSVFLTFVAGASALILNRSVDVHASLDPISFGSGAERRIGGPHIGMGVEFRP